MAVIFRPTTPILTTYFFSISFNVSTSAFSTSTIIPESSPIETGTSTDKNICFPNRRAVGKTSVTKHRTKLPQLFAHRASSLSRGLNQYSWTVAIEFPLLAASVIPCINKISLYRSILIFHSAKTHVPWRHSHRPIFAKMSSQNSATGILLKFLRRSNPEHI